MEGGVRAGHRHGPRRATGPGRGARHAVSGRDRRRLRGDIQGGGAGSVRGHRYPGHDRDLAPVGRDRRPADPARPRWPVVVLPSVRGRWSGVEAPPRMTDDATDEGSVALTSDHREPVIRTRGLTKKYGTLTAVNRLDLEVFPGEIFGLLGQNGAGKTTTILMLLGLSEPTDGEASVMGLDPAREPREVKRLVGYLPDAVGFYGNMTGRQNLRYTARLNGLRRSDAESAIAEVLEQVGLSDRADDEVETY